MQITKEYIRKYWFGIDDPAELAETVLLMERDRIEQYKAAIDLTTNHFNGVFKGITGMFAGLKISIIYSIGPAHIADCVNFLSHGFPIKKLFSTGSVGGMNTQMGDVVLSNSCTTQDGFSMSRKWGEINQNKFLGSYVDVDMQNPITLPSPVRDQIASTFDCEILLGKMFTIPCVSMESKETLLEIKNQGYVALDLETGPFLSACEANQIEGICIHWVTDLPLERDFYYKYHGNPEIAKQDQDKKHRQWLNMPKLILPILKELR